MRIRSRYSLFERQLLGHAIDGASGDGDGSGGEVAAAALEANFGERFDRLRAWHEACRHRPSVRATLADESKLVANYDGYADNSATSAVASSAA